MTDSLLVVDGLDVTFPGRTAVTHAVRNASFTLGRERLGVVGESGSGKTTMGRALLGLLPRTAKVSARTMSYAGTNLLTCTERDWQRLRGRRMSMVMQDPKYSLNPVKTVGKQIGETALLHLRTDRRDAMRRTLAMLEAVQIRDPELVYGLYPHQLSGGMGQRVMIAMMLIAEPDLLIADEPTSALDVTVQNEVLRILDDLVRDRGMGLIMISHNLTMVSSFCDRVLIMYAVRIVEEIAARDLQNAQHPYSRALVAATPSLDVRRAELATVTRDPEWLK
ncbi:MAG: ABC transporter ATP-binding protein [Devosia sp.]|nr:ABC transporter ATP-binding protein [Devosia sp.]